MENLAPPFKYDAKGFPLGPSPKHAIKREIVVNEKGTVLA